MQLRYLTPLVLALLCAVAWSVSGYLEADRELRGGLRPKQVPPPTSALIEELEDELRLPTAPTAKAPAPVAPPSSS
jgi:hypothetical protein